MTANQALHRTGRTSRPAGELVVRYSVFLISDLCVSIHNYREHVHNVALRAVNGMWYDTGFCCQLCRYYRYLSLTSVRKYGIYFIRFTQLQPGLSLIRLKLNT